MLVIFTDGASRGNPGHAASAARIIRAPGKLVKQGSAYLGILTNNQAEYRALLGALRYLVAHQMEVADAEYEFRLDSELVVRHLTGEYRCKDPELQPLLAEAQALVAQLPGTVRFTHIPREQNREADKLANQALNAAGH